MLVALKLVAPFSENRCSFRRCHCNHIILSNDIFNKLKIAHSSIRLLLQNCSIIAPKFKLFTLTATGGKHDDFDIFALFALMTLMTQPDIWSASASRSRFQRRSEAPSAVRIKNHFPLAERRAVNRFFGLRSYELTSAKNPDTLFTTTLKKHFLFR